MSEKCPLFILLSLYSRLQSAFVYIPHYTTTCMNILRVIVVANEILLEGTTSTLYNLQEYKGI